jgi:hypothetical protein
MLSARNILQFRFGVSQEDLVFLGAGFDFQSAKSIPPLPAHQLESRRCRSPAVGELKGPYSHRSES